MESPSPVSKTIKVQGMGSKPTYSSVKPNCILLIDGLENNVTVNTNNGIILVAGEDNTVTVAEAAANSKIYKYGKNATVIENYVSATRPSRQIYSRPPPNPTLDPLGPQQIPISRPNVGFLPGPQHPIIVQNPLATSEAFSTVN